jgi:alpha-beta hydrolase superfamily lysophospholipase
LYEIDEGGKKEISVVSSALLSSFEERAMNDTSPRDYTLLDRPEILSVLFHPRPEIRYGLSGQSGKDLLIPVEDRVSVAARFHHLDVDGPTILFFHGNGEIVADYDDIGPLFGSTGVNFCAVDYRGYGLSTGHPTVSAMMSDAHVVLDYMTAWLEVQGYRGPLVVMGRSLGSAPAIELASSRTGKLAGLIVESGFARTMPLLRLIGADPQGLGLSEDNGCGNLDKIGSADLPTLIIHARNDFIIPVSDGEALLEASAARNKRLVVIPGADHNSIFMVGFALYMGALRTFIESIKGRP